MSEVLSSVEFQSKVLEADKPVLVDFFATWCGPCRMLAPVIEELANDYADKIDVYKVDIDQSPDLASRYGIMSVPTIVLFQGGKPARSATGARPKAAFVQMIDSL